MDEAKWRYRFANVFNGHTFLEFLKQLVRRYNERKVFLIIDNAPYHWLKEGGKEWLKENKKLIELHRLPPYSPEFNPRRRCMEGQSENDNTQPVL